MKRSFADERSHETTLETQTSLTKFTARFVGFSSLPQANRQKICSPQIQSHGRLWSLMIYPQGSLDACKDYLSCYLDCESIKETKAKYSITLVHRSKKAVDYVMGDKNFIELIPSGQTTVVNKGKGCSKFMLRQKVLDEYCLDDTVTFHVAITVYEGVKSSITSSPTLPDFPVAKMPRTNPSTALLFSSLYSDITFQVGSEAIPAHKFTVCSSSAVFHVMFSTAMLEGNTSKVTITDYEPIVVKEMLRYLYTDACTSSACHEHGAALLSIACKYQIESMQEYMERFVASGLSIQNADQVLQLADSLECQRLKSLVLQYIVQNQEAVVSRAGFLANLSHGLSLDIIRALTNAQSSAVGEAEHDAAVAENEQEGVVGGGIVEGT